MTTWAQRAKAAISQTGQTRTAKTDESRVLGVLSVSSVPAGAILEWKKRLSSVLAVPPPAVLEKHDFLFGVVEDPDRWCWPRSLAMNGVEIETFAARVNKFKNKGLPLIDGEALADKLVLRDRESDDRRVCLECTHLVQGWFCNNSEAAGVDLGARRCTLAFELVLQLQRCDGFNESGLPVGS